MQVDRYILSLFNEIRSPYLDVFFEGITWLGSLWLLLPFSVLLTVGMMVTGQYSLGMLGRIYVPASLLIASSLAFVLKAVFDRQRPNLFETWVTLPVDSAFPSAHSAQAAAFFMALWFLLPTSMRWTVGWMLLLIVLAVMASRLYLQVHWPSDVLAGSLLGVGCAIVLRFMLLPKEGI
ncbi:phosphatase PAP2 family protein [Thiothrix sp. UBA2016]|uniref:phosphatase PAP2 family protein n=1 Tax=Thiothrix sp. UBA2016 TaxID=1947695 RepID=UPI0025D0BC05|nr:phosphatase PAP2 family protein [Thiothrix sp. UBA2016]